MKYIQVKWKHTFPAEPVLMYIELDDNRWEVRKVEVFPDGSRGYASAAGSFGETGLGKVPVPPLAKIAEDSEFEPIEISSDEFERIWINRQGKRG